MMMSLSQKLVLALTTVGVICQPLVSASSPTVIWSPVSGLLDESQGHQFRPDLNSASQFETWAKDRFVQETESKATPEILLLLSLSGGDNYLSTIPQVPLLSSEINNSPSSILVPFLEEGASAGSAATSFADVFPSGSRQKLSLESANSLVSSVDSSIGKNDDIDVIMCDCDMKQNEDVDNLVSLIQAVNSNTMGNYAVALFIEPSVAVVPPYVESLTAPQSYRRLEDSDDDDSSDGDPTAYVHMTPDLLAGILTGILLVLIALLGLTCLNDIQTPSQYTDKPPPSNKEF